MGGGGSCLRLSIKNQSIRKLLDNLTINKKNLNDLGFPFWKQVSEAIVSVYVPNR